MANSKQNKGKSITISTTVSPEIKEKVDEICKREDRNTAWLLRKLLLEFLDKQENN